MSTSTSSVVTFHTCTPILSQVWPAPHNYSIPYLLRVSLFLGALPAFSVCFQLPLRVVGFSSHVFLILGWLWFHAYMYSFFHVLWTSLCLDTFMTSFFFLFEEMLKSFSLLKLAGVSDPVFKMLLKLWRLRFDYVWFECQLYTN